MNPCAEPGEGLRQLAPDRAGPDDRHSPGTFGQAEYGLVVEIARLREPFDRRSYGTGSSRDHGLAVLELLDPTSSLHLDATFVADARFTEMDVDAELLRITGRRVLVADPGPDLAHA